MKLTSFHIKTVLIVLLSIIVNTAIAKTGRVYFRNDSFNPVTIKLLDYLDANGKPQEKVLNLGAKWDHISPGANTIVNVEGLVLNTNNDKACCKAEDSGVDPNKVHNIRIHDKCLMTISNFVHIRELQCMRR